MLMRFKDLPTEIFEKCKLRAYAQGVTLNEQAHVKADRSNGGFNWKQTTEGSSFWNRVLTMNTDYDHFYKRYPKNSEFLIKCL